jgi:hypothetical protein
VWAQAGVVRIAAPLAPLCDAAERMIANSQGTPMFLRGSCSLGTVDGTDGPRAAYPCMTRRLAIATLFVALALPAEALAKEPVKATVCGADGCATSEDKDAILPLVEGGPPVATPPTAGAPAYRVRLTIAVDDGPGGGRRETDTFATWMVPTLGLIRGSEGTWLTLPATTLAALRRVAGDIRPFPAARLPLGGGGENGASPSPAVAPAPKPAPAASAGADWTLLGGIAGGVLAALACAAAATAVARRRRGGPPTQPAPLS